MTNVKLKYSSRYSSFFLVFFLVDLILDLKRTAQKKKKITLRILCSDLNMKVFIYNKRNQSKVKTHPNSKTWKLTSIKYSNKLNIKIGFNVHILTSVKLNFNKSTRSVNDGKLMIKIFKKADKKNCHAINGNMIILELRGQHNPLKRVGSSCS